MRIKAVTIVLTLMVILFSENPTFGYEIDVHFKMCEEAVKNSILNTVLIDRLCIQKGVGTPIKNEEEKKIVKWIAFGGKREDDGLRGEGDDLEIYRAFWEIIRVYHAEGGIVQWG